MSGTRYFDRIAEILDVIRQKDLAEITKAARLVADTVEKGGIVQAFGCGHSRAGAMEISRRAGGLVPVKLLDEPSEGRYEKVQGVGTLYMSECDVRPGDLFVIISNSGVNPMPVEVALFAKKLGCPVIALSALDVAHAEKPRSASGKKLYEIADVTLDLHSVYGDAAIEVEGVESKVCGTSSVITDCLLNAMMLEAIEMMVEDGFEPPVLSSGNVEGGEERSRALVMKYYDRMLRNHRLY